MFEARPAGQPIFTTLLLRPRKGADAAGNRECNQRLGQFISIDTV